TAPNSAKDPCQQFVKTYYCPSRRSPGVLSSNNTGNNGAGVANPRRTGALSDYAVVAGNGNNQGAMRIAIPSGTINGKPASGNAAFNASGKGARVLSWKSQTTLQSITDGTSNTMLIGEKFIRIKSSFQGKNEDRSIYDGNNANNFHRFAGVNTDPKNP